MNELNPLVPRFFLLHTLLLSCCGLGEGMMLFKYFRLVMMMIPPEFSIHSLAIRVLHSLILMLALQVVGR
jgi:hypothetical protein